MSLGNEFISNQNLLDKSIDVQTRHEVNEAITASSGDFTLANPFEVKVEGLSNQQETSLIIQSLVEQYSNMVEKTLYWKRSDAKSKLFITVPASDNFPSSTFAQQNSLKAGVLKIHQEIIIDPEEQESFARHEQMIDNLLVRLKQDMPSLTYIRCSTGKTPTNYVYFESGEIKE